MEELQPRSDELLALIDDSRKYYGKFLRDGDNRSVSAILTHTTRGLNIWLNESRKAMQLVRDFEAKAKAEVESRVAEAQATLSAAIESNARLTKELTEAKYKAEEARIKSDYWSGKYQTRLNSKGKESPATSKIYAFRHSSRSSTMSGSPIEATASRYESLSLLDDFHREMKHRILNTPTHQEIVNAFKRENQMKDAQISEMDQEIQQLTLLLDNTSKGNAQMEKRVSTLEEAISTLLQEMRKVFRDGSTKLHEGLADLQKKLDTNQSQVSAQGDEQPELSLHLQQLMKLFEPNNMVTATAEDPTERELQAVSGRKRAASDVGSPMKRATF